MQKDSLHSSVLPNVPKVTTPDDNDNDSFQEEELHSSYGEGDIDE